MLGHDQNEQMRTLHLLLVGADDLAEVLADGALQCNPVKRSAGLTGRRGQGCSP